MLDDAGYFAGTAYTTDPNGFRDLGALVVVLVSLSGEIVAKHETPRVSTTQFGSHNAPHPTSSGLFMDATNQRFIVRVTDPDWQRSLEEWNVYDSRTGKHVPVGSPLDPNELAPVGRGDSRLGIPRATGGDVEITGSARKGFGVDFSADGAELWVVDGVAREFRRYALPSE